MTIITPPGRQYALVTEDNQGLRELYLETYGGTLCLDPSSVGSLEGLVRDGYVQTSVCKDDKRSRHGAKTCAVGLVWLTEKGVSGGKDRVQSGLEKGLEAFAAYVESLGYRTRLLILYRLNKWARKCSAAQTPPQQPLRRLGRATPWVMLPRFEWDVRVPGKGMNLVSILPERVGGEIRSLPEKLVGFGLAAMTSTGHDRKGWYPKEALVTCEEVAGLLMKTYGGFEQPFPLDPLVRTLRKSYHEYRVIQTLEVNKRLGALDLDQYMRDASYSDLLEFLESLENIGDGSYATVNWPVVEKCFAPGRKIGLNWEDYYGEVLTIRTTQYLLEPWAMLRYERLLGACKKDTEKWFEEEGDKRTEEQPPSWNELYAMSKEYYLSRFYGYTELAKMKLGTGTEDRDALAGSI